MKQPFGWVAPKLPSPRLQIAPRLPSPQLEIAPRLPSPLIHNQKPEYYGDMGVDGRRDGRTNSSEIERRRYNDVYGDIKPPPTRKRGKILVDNPQQPVAVVAVVAADNGAHLTDPKLIKVFNEIDEETKGTLMKHIKTNSHLEKFLKSTRQYRNAPEADREAELYKTLGNARDEYYKNKK